MRMNAAASSARSRSLRSPVESFHRPPSPMTRAQGAKRKFLGRSSQIRATADFSATHTTTSGFIADEGGALVGFDFSRFQASFSRDSRRMPLARAQVGADEVRRAASQYKAIGHFIIATSFSKTPPLSHIDDWPLVDFSHIERMLIITPVAIAAHTLPPMLGRSSSYFSVAHGARGYLALPA